MITTHLSLNWAFGRYYIKAAASNQDCDTRQTISWGR
jgi:hypothetical protein